jgi:hypothetical protein
METSSESGATEYPLPWLGGLPGVTEDDWGPLLVFHSCQGEGHARI